MKGLALTILLAELCTGDIYKPYPIIMENHMAAIDMNTTGTTTIDINKGTLIIIDSKRAVEQALKSLSISFSNATMSIDTVFKSFKDLSRNYDPIHHEWMALYGCETMPYLRWLKEIPDNIFPVPKTLITKYIPQAHSIFRMMHHLSGRKGYMLRSKLS